MNDLTWRPGAAAARAHRARLNAGLRAFFAALGVLEVETPLLAAGAPQDPAIESWRASAPDGTSGYLQTSPEYPMKRLLADGSRDIYQLARVFRGGEQGRRHNPEFTLLEWYRLGYDHHRLMAELIELVHSVVELDPRWHRPEGGVRRLSYRDLFRDKLGLDPLSCTSEQCAAAASDAGFDVTGSLDRDAWLDALMSLVLAPGFPSDSLTLVFDYPESQAVLARPSEASPGCASRFELYWGDLELANGFHELTEPEIFLVRRDQDRTRRAGRGQELPKIDRFFAAAMMSGLPDCAGVALGVDRLLMCLLGTRDIATVIDFPWGRA